MLWRRCPHVIDGYECTTDFGVELYILPDLAGQWFWYTVIESTMLQPDRRQFSMLSDAQRAASLWAKARTPSDIREWSW